MYNQKDFCPKCDTRLPDLEYCPDCGVDITPYHNCHGSDHSVRHVCRKPYYDRLTHESRWDEEDDRIRNSVFRQRPW